MPPTDFPTLVRIPREDDPASTPQDGWLIAASIALFLLALAIPVR